jgi:hypothetical protein
MGRLSAIDAKVILPWCFSFVERLIQAENMLSPPYLLFVPQREMLCRNGRSDKRFNFTSITVSASGNPTVDQTALRMEVAFHGVCVMIRFFEVAAFLKL